MVGDPATLRRARRLLTAILVPLIVATVVGLVLLWPHGGQHSYAALAGEDERGVVTAVTACPKSAGACDTVSVLITGGRDKGRTVTMQVQRGALQAKLSAGDGVLVSVDRLAPAAQQYTFDDRDRSRPLALLVALFAIAVLAMARWRGLAALGALAVSVVALTEFVLPAILAHSDPLLVAVVASAAIMIVTLYLTHGFRVETSIALVGIMVALAVTGVLGYAFIVGTRITGLGDESASYLGSLVGGLDIPGLLVAGLVIGTLGVLDDVAVTQAAVVWELAAARPGTPRRELFTAGLRVGRAHVTSVVNTLVLAYAGAALPLLALFSISSVAAGYLVSTEIVAIEVVRGLVGSLGVILAVPLTTALAAAAIGAPKRRPVAAGEVPAGTRCGQDGNN